MSTKKPLSETNFSKQWWQFELQLHVYIYIYKVSSDVFLNPFCIFSDKAD